MLQNRSKSVVVLTVVALGSAFALWLSAAGAGRASGPGDEKGLAKEAADRIPPFTPTVGQHYQIFWPEGRELLGYRQLALVQRAYSNGWVEVKTEEGQITYVNLNQTTHLYRIDDVKKFRELTRTGGRGK